MSDLTGKPAESGGVSKVFIFECIDEDCCQAGQLVELDIAVSFGMIPRVRFGKVLKNRLIMRSKEKEESKN